MRKSVATGSIIALALAAGPVMAADGFSYNLIEGSYVDTELDDNGPSLKGDGAAVAGSVELTPSLFGFASVNDLNYDAGISSNAYSLGMGAHFGLTPQLDLISGVSFERLRVKISGVGSASEEGYGLSLGLRGRVAERLELTAAVKYVDLGHGIDDTTLSAGGRYYFTPAFAAGIDVSDNSDGTTWGIALRYDFGKRF